MFTFRSRIGTCAIGALVLTSLAVMLVYSMLFAPLTQPTSSFSVSPGDSVRNVAEHAKNEGTIRSELAFLLWYQLFYSEAPILAGQYSLPDELSLQEFVAIITSGDIAEEYVAITFPEGVSTDEMVAIVQDSATNIDSTKYAELVEGKEGFMFPDTYFIAEMTSAEELFTLQTEAYEAAITPYQAALAEHSLSEDEVITLASIIEREANSEQSMRMVSGILQNRLAIDMPLQADASIEYILDKPLSELTPDDLKEESPYNTYRNRGLPPTPINNPGIVAIAAVLDPTESDYFYYITGRNGQFYYAETLAEHNENIARYLR